MARATRTTAAATGMETSTYVALSRQKALMRQLDIVANNVANATTSGYKSDRMEFAEHVAQVRAKHPMSQVRASGVYRDLGEGPIVETGNTFDLALKGDGYFVVNTPLGPRYTRNGGFTLDPTGRLVTSWGDEVQSEGGTIAISAGETGITITTDGTVSSRESGPIGKLRVVRFDDEQRLRKVKNGLYTTDLPAQDVVPGEVRVVQGAIEGSNVNPVAEIARMIKLQRFFEALQKIVEQEHKRQRNTINQIFRPL